MTGEVIGGRYRLLEPLGRGSMSSVWLAHDDDLDRDVAIKTLAPTADRARFEREARAVAGLSHPNICNLYDYGESDGKPYMVLEYLPGGTLEDRLASGTPLPDAETEAYAAAIAAGLAHAHAHGVVHRDLKPANVLFDAEDRPKIADFGIARMGTDGTLTEAGTVLGTAAYISPEQASGNPATAASDVYSFGVILFRMLTGRLPFVSTNAMELVRMNRDDPAPAVSDLRADAPAGLAWTADAALAKDPAARPADGAALVAALRSDDTSATMLLPAVAGAGPVRPARRRSLVPAMIVLALVLLLGGAALALALGGGFGGGSGGTDAPPGSIPSISLPSVPTVSTAKTSSTVATTAPATTRATSSASTPTTTKATTTAHTTTAHTTTAHTTTARVSTYQPTTTVAPPTTYYTTTAATVTTGTTPTTDTTATTTAATTTGP